MTPPEGGVDKSSDNGQALCSIVLPVTLKDSHMCPMPYGRIPAALVPATTEELPVLRTQTTSTNYLARLDSQRVAIVSQAGVRIITMPLEDVRRRPTRSGRWSCATARCPTRWSLPPLRPWWGTP